MTDVPVFNPSCLCLCVTSRQCYMSHSTYYEHLNHESLFNINNTASSVLISLSSNWPEITCSPNGFQVPHYCIHHISCSSTTTTDNDKHDETISITSVTGSTHDSRRPTATFTVTTRWRQLQSMKRALVNSQQWPVSNQVKLHQTETSSAKSSCSASGGWSWVSFLESSVTTLWNRFYTRTHTTVNKAVKYAAARPDC